ncbi:hypothetical protein JVT61DRAFT_7448 [Boletus reticuloceps]|uniref:Uncharacterized protein n=1 Tax=Boletus reticuloceps TaxID=495285 RepID=A0A8I2YIH1_9AGAM|nr:hypothetical protein JVT61DRAFT_7448 [Boletus reticuloceps]
MLTGVQCMSLHGVVNGDVNGAAPAPSSDLVTELENVQAQFELYKVEMGMDAEQLRKDFAQAQRQLSQANTVLSKATAKIEFLNDLDSLALCNQQLYDQQTCLDIDCERVMDKLAVTKGDLEQLRNEAMNLCAEKKIWKNAQNQLAEENKNLATECSQLSHLMANVQRMHNDLERSGENDRRCLESQVQMVENHTQDLKSQLSQECKNLRHITLQRDIDMKELQSCLDKIVRHCTHVERSGPYSSNILRPDSSPKHGSPLSEPKLAKHISKNRWKNLHANFRETRRNSLSMKEGHPVQVLPLLCPIQTCPMNNNSSKKSQTFGVLSRQHICGHVFMDILFSAQLKVAQVDLAAARNHMHDWYII